ncbi:hypothetical protein AB5A14_003070 [Vibrio cholerae]
MDSIKYIVEVVTDYNIEAGYRQYDESTDNKIESLKSELVQLYVEQHQFRIADKRSEKEVSGYVENVIKIRSYVDQIIALEKENEYVYPIFRANSESKPYVIYTGNARPVELIDVNVSISTPIWISEFGVWVVKHVTHDVMVDDDECVVITYTLYCKFTDHSY